MKKILTGIMAVAMLAGIQAFAQEEEESSFVSKLIPSVDIAAQYKSRYLSDGRVVNPDDMLFMDAFFSWNIYENDDFANGLYFDLWCANDLNRYNKADGIDYEPEEFDYTIGYTLGVKNFECEPLSLKGLNFDLSYAYWDYPSRTGWQCVGSQQNTITLDISTSVVNDVLDVTPGITINWDPEDEKYYGKGYLKLGDEIWNNEEEGNKKQSLSWNTKFELFAGNSRYTGNAFSEIDDTGDIYKSTFTTFVWTVGLDFSPMPGVSVGPFGVLSWALDHECRDAWKIDDNSKSGVNNLWGIGASFSF